jgi:hypothetical protein
VIDCGGDWILSVSGRERECELGRITPVLFGCSKSGSGNNDFAQPLGLFLDSWRKSIRRCLKDIHPRRISKPTKGSFQFWITTESDHSASVASLGERKRTSVGFDQSLIDATKQFPAKLLP